MKIHSRQILFCGALTLALILGTPIPSPGESVSAKSSREKSPGESLREIHIPQRIFLHNYEKTWKAILRASKKYEQSLADKENGILISRWIDNTNPPDDPDNLIGEDELLFDGIDEKANKVNRKFQLSIHVREGTWKEHEATHVTIFKKQKIYIEDGNKSRWMLVPSDGILEKVLLHRIGRLLFLDRVWQQKARAAGRDQARTNPERKSKRP